MLYRFATRSPKHLLTIWQVTDIIRAPSIDREHPQERKQQKDTQEWTVEPRLRTWARQRRPSFDGISANAWCRPWVVPGDARPRWKADAAAPRGDSKFSLLSHLLPIACRLSSRLSPRRPPAGTLRGFLFPIPFYILCNPASVTHTAGARTLIRTTLQARSVPWCPRLSLTLRPLRVWALSASVPSHILDPVISLTAHLATPAFSIVESWMRCRLAAAAAVATWKEKSRRKRTVYPTRNYSACCLEAMNSTIYDAYRSPRAEWICKLCETVETWRLIIFTW